MTVALLAAAVVGVVGLLSWFARRNPGATEAVPGLFGRAPTARADRRNPGLLAWEADLLAASTGGPRGRARVARRLEPTLEAVLRDRHGLRLDDEAAAVLLGEEWEFLTGGPPPASSPRLDAQSALARLLDRVDADRHTVTARPDRRA